MPGQAEKAFDFLDGKRGLSPISEKILNIKVETRFIDGVTVVEQKTGKTYTGTVDIGSTLDRIKTGGVYPHRNDGTEFRNKAGDLPIKAPGYYTEYVVPTPGFQGPGPQRVVVGNGGEVYYTADHYRTFIPVTK